MLTVFKINHREVFSSFSGARACTAQLSWTAGLELSCDPSGVHLALGSTKQLKLASAVQSGFLLSTGSLGQASLNYHAFPTKQKLNCLLTSLIKDVETDQVFPFVRSIQQILSDLLFPILFA